MTVRGCTLNMVDLSVWKFRLIEYRPIGLCDSNYICITGAWNSPHKNLNDMPKKVTSARVASKASKALTDGRSSARTKSIAGSALSQREKSSRRK